MRKLAVLAMLFTFLVTSLGCAHLLTGDTQVMTFTSEPEGATVYIDGRPMGKTPLTLQMERHFGSSKVDFKLPGYAPQQVDLGRTFNFWALTNVFVGAVPIIFDFISGAIVWISPDYVRVEMVKKENSTGINDVK